MHVNDMESLCRPLMQASLRNAIPREAFATVVVPVIEEGNFKKFIEEAQISVKTMLKDIDPDIKIETEKTEMPKFVWDVVTQHNFYNAVEDCLVVLLLLPARSLGRPPDSRRHPDPVHPLVLRHSGAGPHVGVE